MNDTRAAGYPNEQPWVVHHRDGWCALPPGAEPDPQALNDPYADEMTLDAVMGYGREAAR